MSDEFTPGNALERALQEAAVDPAARPRFLHELLASDVYVVIAGKMPDIVDGVLQPGTSIDFGTIAWGDTRAIPFGTSTERLPPGATYLQFPATSLFEMTRGAHLVMNPASSYGKEFVPDEIAALLDGTMFAGPEPYVVPKQTEVLVGAPLHYPQELADALGRLYEKHTGVRRAWLAAYVNPEREPESALLIALDVDTDATMEKAAGESGIVIESVRTSQQSVDMVRYSKTGVSGYFTDQKPFYQKKPPASLWNKLFK